MPDIDIVKVFSDNADNQRYTRVPITPEAYTDAYNHGVGFSEYLEKLDPSWEYTGPLAEMDAFQRQLLRYNLPISSDPAKGIYAARGEYWLLDESHRILFKETLDREARTTLFSDKWDVNKLLASTRFINGESSKGVDIDMSAIEANPLFKVGKGGEFPVVSVAWSDTEAYIAKRGVALKWTYEFIRRARIDLARLILQRIVLSDRKASFDYAVGCLLNGATVTTTESLDSACTVAAPLTYTAWISWLHKAFGVYTPDIVITNLANAVKIVTMTRPSIAPGDVLRLLEQSKASSIPTISLADNLNVSPTLMVVDDSVLTSTPTYAIGIDSRFAMERLIETGSDIAESQQFITNQTVITTQSLNEGYNKVWSDATQVLDITGTD